MEVQAKNRGRRMTLVRSPASREGVASYSHDHVLFPFRVAAAGLTSRARHRCPVARSSVEGQGVPEQARDPVREARL